MSLANLADSTEYECRSSTYRGALVIPDTLDEAKAREVLVEYVRAVERKRRELKLPSLRWTRNGLAFIPPVALVMLGLLLCACGGAPFSQVVDSEAEGGPVSSQVTSDLAEGSPAAMKDGGGTDAGSPPDPEGGPATLEASVINLDTGSAVAEHDDASDAGPLSAPEAATVDPPPMMGDAGCFYLLADVPVYVACP
jgi:hypothetical protein